MAVISDTTVLIALAQVGYLWLLKKLWALIVIPAAVRDEALRGVSGSKEISSAIDTGWIQVKEVQNRHLVKILQGTLRGRGECECIVLAGEISTRIILTDDKKARRIALESGLEVIGTLGLLVQSAGEGVLTREEALGAIERLRATNFRLSEEVIKCAIDLIKGSRKIP